MQLGAEQENVQQNRRILHRRAEVRDGPSGGVRNAATTNGGGQSAPDDKWLGSHAQASVGPVSLDGLHQHRLHDLNQPNSHLREAAFQSETGSPREQGIVEGRTSVRVFEQKHKQVFHRNSHSHAHAHAHQNFQPKGICEAAAPDTESEGPTTATGIIADLRQQQHPEASEGHFGCCRCRAPDARHVEDRLETEGGQDPLPAAEEETQDKGEVGKYRFELFFQLKG